MKAANALAMALLLWCTAGMETVLSEEPPRLNDKVRARSAAAGLEKEFRALAKQQAGSIWIGYTIPTVDGSHRVCYDSDGGMNTRNDEGRDEGSRAHRVAVLCRVADQRVSRIRFFSEDYELIVVDTDGLPVFWLTEVRPSESVAFLASFVKGADALTKSDRRRSEVALAAIAFHDDPAADQALEQLADPRQPLETRKNAAFWLGDLRGQRGCDVLRRMLRDDPSDKVREHCIFALHLCKVPDAIDITVETARHDRSRKVREQALFWLSQKAGQKAAEAIAGILQNDPETEIKKKAVFALSQLPKDEGIPRLIQVARTLRNKEVLKEAIFWLGQSHDPRALEFFEEILMK